LGDLEVVFENQYVPDIMEINLRDAMTIFGIWHLRERSFAGFR